MSERNSNNFITADEARTVIKHLNLAMAELSTRINHYNIQQETKDTMRFKGRYATYTHDISVLSDFVKTLEPYAIPTALESTVNSLGEMGIPQNIIEQVITEYLSNTENVTRY